MQAFLSPYKIDRSNDMYLKYMLIVSSVSQQFGFYPMTETHRLLRTIVQLTLDTCKTTT